jgi:hypothetical protein
VRKGLNCHIKYFFLLGEKDEVAPRNNFPLKTSFQMFDMKIYEINLSKSKIIYTIEKLLICRYLKQFYILELTI